MKKRRKDKKGNLLLKGESQRADGCYIFRYTENGKRYQISSMSLGELRLKEKMMEKTQAANLLRSSSQITLNEAYEKYKHLKRSISESTFMTHEAYWNGRIKNSIGESVLSTIKKTQIIEFLQSLKDAGLKYSSINNYYSLLCYILEICVEDDLIIKNPCKGAMKYVEKDETEGKISLTHEQADTLIEEIRNSQNFTNYVMAQTFLKTGLRSSECAGLCWENIDFKKKRITINHQLYYTKGKDGRFRWKITTPKTQKGARIIPIPTSLCELLKKQHEYQFSNGLVSNFEVDGYKNWVFTNSVGMPKDHTVINRSLYQATRRIRKKDPEFPKFSVHVLRHTYITWLVESGMNPETIDIIVGHENYALTLRVYTHISDDKVAEEYRRVMGE